MRESIHNPYQTMKKACLCLGTFLMLAGGTGLTWLFRSEPGLNRQPVLACFTLLSIGVGGGVLFGGLLLWFLCRSVDRLIDRIVNRESTIHWTYMPEEWKTFQKLERSRHKATFLRSPIFQILPYILPGLLLFGTGWLLLDGQDAQGLVWAIYGACAFFVLTIPIAWLTRSVISNRSFYGQTRSHPPDTFLHPLYGFAEDRFLFGISGYRLTGVTLLEGEICCVELTVTKSGTHLLEYEESFRVPVPNRNIHEAIEFVKHMRELALYGSTIDNTGRQRSSQHCKPRCLE